MKRLFVVGCQRSGTTLVRMLLESHPEISCVDEPRAYAALRDRLHLSAGMVGYKIPRWTEQLNCDRLSDGGLDLVCPRFYDGEPIVFVVRNVLDVVGSMMRLQVPGGNWWSVWGIQALERKLESREFLARYRAELQTIGDVGGNPFAAAALYWKYKVVSLGEYRELRWPVHALHYENLVTNPREELGTLFTFLGLPWDERVLRHHVQTHADLYRNGKAIGGTDPRRPIDRASVEQWRTAVAPHQVDAIRAVVSTGEDVGLGDVRTLEKV